MYSISNSVLECETVVPFLAMFFLANYYNETIALNFSSSNRVTDIECRAFLNEIPEVPCCNKSNDKALCQPDTGIARVIVHVVGLSDPSAATLCKAGVDLNSVLPLNDECPLNGDPKFCTMNSSIKVKGTGGKMHD